MLSNVLYALAQVCGITEGVLLIYCVLTWFLSRTSRVMQILSEILEPMLMPIRRLTARLTGAMGLDFSPFILMLILQAMQSLLVRLAWQV